MDHKICFINSCKAWGGGEKWHFDTAKRLHDEGFDVLVITNKKSKLYEKIQPTDILNQQFVIRNLSFLNPLRIYQLYNIIKSFAPGTVILGLPSDVKTGGIASKLAGVEKIIYRRGTALPVKRTWLNRWLFKHVVTKIIANSQEIQKLITKKFSKDLNNQKVQLIYNGIEIEKISLNHTKLPLEKSSEDEIIMGNAGRLVEQKGQKYLVELASILKEKKYKFKIYIAGSGKLYRELTAYIKEKNVEEHVFLLDFLNNVPDFIKALDIFLFPSLHEGSANVLLEAMTLKKPVVGFRISSIPEIIEHNEDGLLVPYPNMEAFSDEVIRLMENKSLREKIGTNARNKIIEKFNFNNTYMEVRELIS
jgi:glycosyltransferase involved in cell wall biosynthesis